MREVEDAVHGEGSREGEEGDAKVIPICWALDLINIAAAIILK